MSDNESITIEIEQKVLAARDLIRTGDLESAEKSLSSILNVDKSGYASLQLANAYLYLERYSEAISLTDNLFAQAKEQRDALLTIAALVTKGEVIIDMVTFTPIESEIQSAIESFGKALGISELFVDEVDPKITVLPLSGLAHSHWLWGNPKKAAELAVRAMTRAQDIETEEGDILKARAYLSAAITLQTPEAFQKAIEQAKVAKHTPLKLRAERFRDFYLKP